MSRPRLVTGATGLIGRSLVARLEELGLECVGVGSELDLRDAAVARRLLAEVRPGIVYHLAARVGGIYANATQKAGFYRDNVLINTHVVDAAVEQGVEYFFGMGTGCAYPKRLEGALLREEDYLDGVPEGTNDAYAYAKRGMLVHLEALAEQGAIAHCYCLPANLYGPHDNYHPTHSHVVPALVRRFVEAVDAGLDEVVIWGDGSAQRDFLFVEDCVDAMALLTERRFGGRVNVAAGEQTSIGRLAQVIAAATDFKGSIGHDHTKPSGQTERVVSVERISDQGWRPRHTLEEGIAKTVEWFRRHRDVIRER